MYLPIYLLSVYLPIHPSISSLLPPFPFSWKWNHRSWWAWHCTGHESDAQYAPFSLASWAAASSRSTLLAGFPVSLVTRCSRKDPRVRSPSSPGEGPQHPAWAARVRAGCLRNRGWSPLSRNLQRSGWHAYARQREQRGRLCGDSVCFLKQVVIAKLSPREWPAGTLELRLVWGNHSWKNPLLISFPMVLRQLVLK